MLREPWSDRLASLSFIEVKLTGLDFDFGDTRLKHLSNGVNFPWVLSNAFHASGNKKTTAGGLLGCAQEYVIRELNGLRIGFFGLAGTYATEKQKLDAQI